MITFEIETAVLYQNDDITCKAARKTPVTTYREGRGEDALCGMDDFLRDTILEMVAHDNFAKHTAFSSN